MIAVSDTDNTESDPLLQTIQSLTKEMNAIRQELLEHKKNGKKPTKEQLDKLNAVLKEVNSFRTELNNTYQSLYNNPQTKLGDF